MSLKLYSADPIDATRIAETHMAAFGTDNLLRAQFPSPSFRAGLQVAIEQKALADILDPKISVLVVRAMREKVISVDKRDDGRMGLIISFAKWSHPKSEGEDYTEPPWVWPEGSNFELLEKWAQESEIAYKAALGQAPCYYLSFIGTDPLYERRGAASLMLQWGIEHCQKDNTSAYLESTVEAGPLYKKNGFVEAGVIFVILGGCPEVGSPKIYEEICFVFNKTTF